MAIDFDNISFDDVQFISEDEVEHSRGGKRKLPEWTPILSWTRPQVPNFFWEWRGYGQPTEKDFEEIEKTKSESLAKQNDQIDRQIEVLRIRKETVLEIRNQKEVRIKL